MNKIENSFARRKNLGMTMGFVRRRRVLAGIAAILIGASFVFSGNASAHNIDLAKARDVAREYAGRCAMIQAANTCITPRVVKKRSPDTTT